MVNPLSLERSFFARRGVLDLLKKRVVDLKDGYRKNIAFLGPQYIGKTAILQRFLANLDDPQIIPIYLDVEGKDFSRTYYNFVTRLLFQFSRVKGLALHEDLTLLLESVKTVIPKTVEFLKAIRHLVAKKKTAEAYRQLMSLPEIFTMETGLYCVIILDEFHGMADWGIEDVFQELGKRIMTQTRCFYLVTSSLKDVAKQILSEKLSLLFGHFEIVEIGPFDPVTSREFIAVSLGEIAMGEGLKDFLIDFTGGHPFYLSILMQEVVHLMAAHGQREVFVPVLAKASENTIFNRWGILSRHFEIIIKDLFGSKNSQETYAILIALSLNQHKIEEIVVETDLKKNFVTQRLARLQELGLVEKSGNYFYLIDKLFRYWIKYIFQKRFQAFDSDLDKQTEAFGREFAQAFAEFQLVAQKDLSLRVIELLGCFDNEAFLFQGRRYRLPFFNKIKPLKLKSPLTADNELDVIKASSTEGPWFIVLKDGAFSEGEMNAFLAESRKLTHKPQRSIIISLKDLEDATRLKALQEKMWVWSEAELNMLFNMYDKPYIVK